MLSLYFSIHTIEGIVSFMSTHYKCQQLYILHIIHTSTTLCLHKCTNAFIWAHITHVHTYTSSLKNA